MEYQSSAFYCIKSILYSLIYRNDRICINYIRNEKDPLNKKFVFINNPESDNICKIFANVINKFNRCEDVSKTIIYDFYIRKIFELMIGKNEFYLKSLQNMLHPSIPNYQINLLTSSEVQLEMRQFLYFPYLKKIVNFCTNLNIYNRDYFDYNINYETYLQKVKEIFNDLKHFMDDEVNCVPDLTKKYQTFFEKGITDDLGHERLSHLQTSVRYTLFFQKIEEFVHIYSEGKKFGKDVDVNKNVETEYLKTILHFMYLLVHNNYENLCLLMNIKTKIFVGAFFNVHDNLFDFMERISEMLYNDNHGYKYDNFYFFCEVLNDIQDKIDFENNANNDDNIKNLSYLSRIMKICQKSLQYISMAQPDPLNCVEKIVDKIRVIKNDPKLYKMINDQFFEDQVLNIKLTQPISTFLNNYFNFVNELIYCDLYFFGLIKDSDMLFEVATVEYILNYQLDENLNNLDTSITLPVDLEYSMTRFYQLQCFGFNFRISDNKILTNLFMKNIPSGVKNISLLHLNKNPNELDNHPEIEKLENRTCFLIKMFKKFDSKFEKFSSHFAPDQLISRKIFLLNYFEHCAIRPTFNILNKFILNANNIKGTVCYSLFELCFYFLKTVIYFYENIEKVKVINSSIDLENENNKDYSRNVSKFDQNLIEEKNLLKRGDIYEYEEIYIKTELDLGTINEIVEETLKFSKNQIKYFELEKIYDIFVKCLKKVLKSVDEANIQNDITPQTGRPTFTGLSAIYTSIKTSKKDSKKPWYVLRLEKLVEKYTDKVKSTYDNALSMVKILESDTDAENELGIDLYEYLMSKFSDSLTEYNFSNPKFFNEYQPGEVSLLDINKFKYQNIYTLIYLNALFYHDSERFQEILKDNIGDNYELFFTFLTKNLIFPSVLVEVKKNYELENGCIYGIDQSPFISNKKKSLAFEISTVAVKLLQNLCENHNQEFQTRFFHFIYKEEQLEYKYKDFNTSVIEAAEKPKSRDYLSHKRLTIEKIAKNESKKELLLFDLGLGNIKISEENLVTEKSDKHENLVANDSNQKLLYGTTNTENTVQVQILIRSLNYIH